jgi:hypothetical protein
MDEGVAERINEMVMVGVVDCVEYFAKLIRPHIKVYSQG